MNTTSRLHRESKLPAGITADAVIAMLHDHNTVVHLNPLVKSVEDIEAPSHAAEEYKGLPWKKVVDEIAYLPAGIWKGSVEYEACFEDRPNGIKANVWAPMGLTTSSTWAVIDAKDGEGLVLSEDCETRCSFLMMPFVKKTQNEAHETMVCGDCEEKCIY